MRNQPPNRSQDIDLLHMETFGTDDKIIISCFFFSFQIAIPYFCTEFEIFHECK